MLNLLTEITLAQLLLTYLPRITWGEGCPFPPELSLGSKRAMLHDDPKIELWGDIFPPGRRPGSE